MAAPTATHGSGVLTKPVDWAVYMVDAALKVTEDEELPIKYKSENEGKLEMLKTLNFHEAHEGYSWPDFPALGFNFAQTMRLRRALVHDVFSALLKNGKVVTVDAVGLGTPESSGKKRSNTNGDSGRKKRVCDRIRAKGADDESTFEDKTDEEKPFWDNDAYLAETMRKLIDVSQVDDYDIELYSRRENDTDTLANLVHDSLVAVWDSPRQVWHHYCRPSTLVEKEQAWARIAKDAPGKPPIEFFPSERARSLEL